MKTRIAGGKVIAFDGTKPVVLDNGNRMLSRSADRIETSLTAR